MVDRLHTTRYGTALAASPRGMRQRGRLLLPYSRAGEGGVGGVGAAPLQQAGETSRLTPRALSTPRYHGQQAASHYHPTLRCWLNLVRAHQMHRDSKALGDVTDHIQIGHFVSVLPNEPAMTR